jgi:hypothetical protein
MMVIKFNIFKRLKTKYKRLNIELIYGMKLIVGQVPMFGKD